MHASIRKRFIFSVLINFLRGILGFFTGIFLARFLGPDSYGDMAFLMGSFMGILSLLNMGSTSAFFTFLSQENRSKKFVSSFFVWLAIQFFLTLIVIGFFFPDQWIKSIWLGQKLSLILLAFIAIFFQGTVWSTMQHLGESQRKTFLVQSVSLGISLIHLVSLVLLWFNDLLGLYAIFIIIFIEYLIVAIFLYREYSFKKNNAIEDINNKNQPIITKYFNYCLPLIPYAWVGFAYIFIDRWLLQYYGGNVEQAYYAIAAQFAAVALIFTSSIMRIFWKEISEAKAQGNKKKIKRLYKKISRVLFLVSAIIVGFLMPWTEVIVSKMLGEAYQGGVVTLAIMLLYPIYQSMGQITGTMLYASEHILHKSIIGIVFMLLSMVAAYFILAPNNSRIPGFGLGSEGLAMKMVLMQFIQVNITAYVIARKWSWSFDWIYQFIGLLGCLSIGWFVNSLAVAIQGDNIPWFITLFVSGIFYMLLIFSFIYILPWLINMNRGEINLGLKIITQRYIISFLNK